MGWPRKWHWHCDDGEKKITLRITSEKQAFIRGCDQGAQVSGIGGRMTQGRVVEDYPSFGLARSVVHGLGELCQCLQRIVAVIHLRRSVPTPVGPRAIAAWLHRRRNDGGIAGNTSNGVLTQERIRIGGKPAWVARFAAQTCVAAPADHAGEG